MLTVCIQNLQACVMFGGMYTEFAGSVVMLTVCIQNLQACVDADSMYTEFAGIC